MSEELELCSSCPPSSAPSAPDSVCPPRFGPRQIRAESAMVRRHNASTGAAPFDSLLVADVGDVNVNLYNLPASCCLIREAFQKIVASGCVPLTLGKDPRGPQSPPPTPQGHPRAFGALLSRTQGVPLKSFHPKRATCSVLICMRRDLRLC